MSPAVRAASVAASDRPAGINDRKWEAFVAWRSGRSFRDVGKAMGLGAESVRTYVRQVRMAVGLVAPGARAREEETAMEKSGRWRVTGNCRCGLRLFGDDNACGDCVSAERATYVGLGPGGLAVTYAGGDSIDLRNPNERGGGRDGVGAFLRRMNGGRAGRGKLSGS